MTTAKYNAERQKKYNQRAREKKAKIKRLCRELDEAEAALEKLPRCPACAALPAGVQCEHTPERRQFMGGSAIIRSQLAEVDH